MSCQYKCGNACDHDVPNESTNEYFGDIVNRRSPVAASCALARGALTLGFAGTAFAAAAPAFASSAAVGECPTWPTRPARRPGR
jgi:hypothetical protein